MRQTIWRVFLWLSMLTAHFLQAQTPTHTISGYIKDAATGEDLIGATVFIKETANGIPTNLYGFYSLTLPEGTYRMTVHYLGYAAQDLTLHLTSTQEMNFKLQAEIMQVKEVEVRAERADYNVSHVQMSANRLNMEQVRKLPALLGEVDIIKTVQAQPGVLAAGEGTSSFFVRGGGADQNLILIDEAPIYDPSHLLGLFSVFNADIVKDVELYKGGMSSRFGGRLSSILDVRTKDGNTEKWGGSGGLGLLASRLMAEGPMVKGKGSFLISGRSSYVNLFLRASNQEARLSYYDINAKLNWKASTKNRYFLTLYFGRDVLAPVEAFSFKWGNMTGTFRWNHVINNKLFLNTTVVGSRFNYTLKPRTPPFSFDWTTYVTQFSIYNDLSYYLNPKTELTTGYHISYRRFLPGLLTPVPVSETSMLKEVSIGDERALDHAFYGEIHRQVGKRWDFRIGMRLSVFQCIGKADVRHYKNPKDNVTIVRTDTARYAAFENIKTFTNPEPRFSARYQLNETNSLKVSYNRMIQNTHLISGGASPLPFNTWAPSNYYLNPQSADQYAIGYFKNVKDNMYELSGELYYKKMKNVTDFADNANTIFNTDIVTEYRQGSSIAYGLELLLQKKNGPLTGNVSYTLSKVTRTIDGVNRGETFDANYDRRNVLNLTAAYDLSDQWSLGGFFTYATGRPVTLPTGSYTFSDVTIDQVSTRNGYRLPDFHRLDLSATYTPKASQKKRWKGQWIFSIYNVYNRKNPFTVSTITTTTRDDNGNVINESKSAKMMYLFPIIPQVTYNFKF